jgi:D-3-phosphoglycerate dehydrogenase
VYEAEPVVDAQHPLLRMPHALCTPHLEYAERDSYEALYALAVDQLLSPSLRKPHQRGES